MRKNEKTVVITGGSTGLGKATAEKFAQEGYKVVLSGRNEEKGKEVANEIKEKYTAECIFIQTDITEEIQVENLIKKSVEQFGCLDVLVNNAGIAPFQGGELAQSETGALKETFDTNVFGLYYAMKYALQVMDKQKSGAIVNVASVSGLNGIKMGAFYAASKHAVVGLTKSAALEYAEMGIQINAIAPGTIHTELFQYFIDTGKFSLENAKAIHPMKRLGTPEDIANGIYYLGSGQSPFMTGSVLTIDGGYLAV
ncbi:SDR family NAD(P)-dependent oxidoreductase [Sinomicrobium soli]|uniref:SDR family NAD(P)-dependent oxidoreductase n=1 Tax=Sinomicrobium sp. N-1-3-6 TaxID=2219864 RepID=UPI00191BF37B|nr:SDR family oxidoreductase [Sinomicrobium sp. N-1-3-6]